MRSIIRTHLGVFLNLHNIIPLSKKKKYHRFCFGIDSVNKYPFKFATNIWTEGSSAHRPSVHGRARIHKQSHIHIHKRKEVPSVVQTKATANSGKTALATSIERFTSSRAIYHEVEIARFRIVVAALAEHE